MYLIVGLGNPGHEYQGTRHNVGFEVADAVARRFKADFRSNGDDWLFAPTEVEGVAVGIVKPLTYMNNSGFAVRELTERLQVPREKLLVICDDFQIPLGSLRLRPQGTDGGHNGIASIIQELGSDTFPRLRCGIGSERMPADKSEMKEFVLEEFDPAEEKVVREMVVRACEATVWFVARGIDDAMNRFNQVVRQ